jgi:uncharacterized repeat protein (TIGR01451 family)
MVKMKKNKILLIALILILGGIFFSSTYAANVERMLGAKLERPFNELHYQYRVPNNIEYSVVKIYDEDDKIANELAYTKALYCLRGGVGFGADGEDIATNSVKYQEIGEMHQDADKIISELVKYMGKTNEENLIVDVSIKKMDTNLQTIEKKVNLYNAILWIIDEIYLPTDKTNNEGVIVYDASEYRDELLSKAGIPRTQQVDITDNDIEVIQQLALWYFTNYDEQLKGKIPTVSQATRFPAQFLSINGDNNIDDERANNLDRLYQYFIYGAIENAQMYDNDNRRQVVSVNEFEKDQNKLSKQIEITERNDLGLFNYYEIGPIKIKSNTGAREETVNVSDIVLYDAEGNIIPREFEISEEDEWSDENGNTITGEKKSGGRMVVYKFLDNNGDDITAQTSLRKDEEYKIRIYKKFIEDDEILKEKYNISSFTLKLTSKYELSTAKFLTAGITTQPVVEIEKENRIGSDKITLGKPKKFDLSLRKFITSIKGEELTGKNSRVPKIDLSKLNTIDTRTEIITTARYIHPKNHLPVEIGNRVVYTIRIYNEGEMDGTATEITDYLPQGLELVPVEESSINKTYGWTNPSGDKKTIVTNYLKDTTIKAYDPAKTTANEGEKWQKAEEGNVESGLYYADVQVECEVVAEVTDSDQQLRNIAEITEDTGDDIDSTPDNVDDEKYNEKPDEGGYFPGNDDQDDDDYENLKLEAKYFDLSLRKFITKVERAEEGTTDIEEIQISREPIIHIDGLKKGTATTAKYVHPKNPLSLKRGDIIYYTIRVYNEGQIDGYVTEVKDYLPEGLELVKGKNDIWTVDGNVLSTDYLKGAQLPAYDKELTEEPITPDVQPKLRWQKAEGDETGLYYYDLQVVCRINDVTDGAILTNIAEITAAKDSEGNEIKNVGDDRDSGPNNFPNEDKNNDYNGNGSVDGYYPGKQDDDDFERVTVEPKEVFDLALRKYIVAVDGENLVGDLSRNPNIDITPLKSAETTADYNHKKDPVPVEVKKNSVVTYRFTVYNEGEITGYVDSIKDYLPEGLEFDKESNTNFIEYKEGNPYTSEELQGKEYAYRIQGNLLEILPISSVSADEGGIVWLAKLDAFNKETEELDRESIDVKFIVTAAESNKDQVLTNVATMTYSSRVENVKDRDSRDEEFNVPTQDKLVSENVTDYKGKDSNKNDLTDKNYHYEGQQDDDDFEKIIIKGKPFDLSLRKYISAVNGEELTEENSRVPKIDTSKLNTVVEGKEITTAEYKHSKEPVIVKKGDLVTYKIRIYNEGQRDGYATKVTDYLPDGLGFIYTTNGDINSEWILSAEGVEAKPLYGEKGIYKDEESILKKAAYKEVFGDDINLANVQIVQAQENEEGKRPKLAVTAGGITVGGTEVNATKLIKAYKSEKEENDLWQQSTNDPEDGLFYQELEITCVVLKDNTYLGTLKNVAEITGAKDSEGNEIKNIRDDRDSEPNNVYSDKKHTPETEVNGYTPGEQDDDDFEPLQLKYFDLRLRKFITGVETNGKLTEITSRIPQLSVNEQNKNTDPIIYTHPKEEAPVEVANNDIVIYTLRVYNEGTLAGYANEITDDIPEGLEYLPGHRINKEFEWKMIDEDGKETEDVNKAEKIITDYLSEGKIATNEEGKSEIRDNIIDPFDASKDLSNTNPDYKDVKVAFKVIEPNSSNRTIVNSAQISEDSDHDEDSDPHEWREKDDDQDKEYIYVKEFDLSLLKWVTQTIVTVDGKTTTTETGFKPNTGLTETPGIRDNKVQEPVAKVEIDKKKLNKTTVKFAYKIRVTNEGEIAGYATEVTDFIPEGLEFKAEDNKKYGWVKEGEDKVTTRALETVLLKPGESAELEIIFTWKNDKNNLGEKRNIAEITEDYNEHESKDIDSVPDNKVDPYEKEQEDDDDFALVILSTKTGKGATYTLFIMSIITVLAGGIYLIKRYVLTY